MEVVSTGAIFAGVLFTADMAANFSAARGAAKLKVTALFASLNAE